MSTYLYRSLIIVNNHYIIYYIFNIIFHSYGLFNLPSILVIICVSRLFFSSLRLGGYGSLLLAWGGSSYPYVYLQHIYIIWESISIVLSIASAVGIRARTNDIIYEVQMMRMLQKCTRSCKAHRCTIHKVWWVEYRYKSTVDGHIMWVTMVCGYDDISNNKKTYRNTLINLTMCMDFVRLCYLMLILCISCVNLIVNLLLEVQGKEICVLVLYCKMGMLWKSLHSTWLHWSKVVLHMWQYHWHKHVDMQQGWRSTWKIEDEVLNSLYCKHFYFELNLTTMQMSIWM